MEEKNTHTYKGRAPVPSEAAIVKVCRKYKDLFCLDALEPSLPFVFSYHEQVVEDNMPEDKEIRTAILRMRIWKAPGLTQILVDDLKRWHQGSHLEQDNKKVDKECEHDWWITVAIVQECFRSETAPSAFCFGTLVLIRCKGVHNSAPYKSTAWKIFV